MTDEKLIEEAAKAIDPGAWYGGVAYDPRWAGEAEHRLVINYCPEHGDLLDGPRSIRCNEAHTVEDIRRTVQGEPRITIEHEGGNTVTGAPEQVLNHGHLKPGWKYRGSESQGEPSDVQLVARGGGKTRQMIDALLAQANERGIRVEVVHPQGEPSDAQVEAGCVAFYEHATGLTSWSRLVDYDKVLANRYRDGMRRALRAAGVVGQEGEQNHG